MVMWMLHGICVIHVHVQLEVHVAKIPLWSFKCQNVSPNIDKVLCNIPSKSSQLIYNLEKPHRKPNKSP
jgi:hypothetical protein